MSTVWRPAPAHGGTQWQEVDRFQRLLFIYTTYWPIAKLSAVRHRTAGAGSSKESGHRPMHDKWMPSSWDLKQLCLPRSNEIFHSAVRSRVCFVQHVFHETLRMAHDPVQAEEAKWQQPLEFGTFIQEYCWNGNTSCFNGSFLLAFNRVCYRAWANAPQTNNLGQGKTHVVANSVAEWPLRNRNEAGIIPHFRDPGME